MRVCKRIISMAVLSVALGVGGGFGITPARADDADLFAYLENEYGDRGTQFNIPADDPFDITRFLGQPDPYVPEAYRWSWQERYFYDGAASASPAPWFSIPWPPDAWRGPF